MVEKTTHKNKSENPAMSARAKYVNPLIPSNILFPLPDDHPMSQDKGYTTISDLKARGLERFVTMPYTERITLDQFQVVTINRDSYTKNPQFFGRILTKVQDFIAEGYKPDDVLSRAEFASELKDTKNKNYTIDAVVGRATKEVVAVVAHDVADVPRTPSADELKSGQYQYTSIYYARAKGGGKFTTAKKYEPVLQMLIGHAMEAGQEYSASKGKTNIGLITIDSKHKRVLHELAQKYGGGYIPVDLGVPTLDDEIVGKDYDKNFVEHHKEKPVFIPNRKWTKSMLNRVVASDLDQSYNHKKPGEKGYIPLTNAQYFKDFATAVKALQGKYVSFRPIAG